MIKILTENAATRQSVAKVYQLLSALYYQPCGEMKPLLSNLEQWTALICPALVDDVMVMQRELARQSEDFTELLVDYARLFVGPFKVLVPPYGSVYLEQAGQVMGDTTLAVAKSYREMGLTFNVEQKDMPDHIAVELEFAYYLLFQGDDIKYRQFMQEHLGAWAGEFCFKLAANAETEFYRRLAQITRKFIEQNMVELALLGPVKEGHAPAIVQ